MKNKSEEIIKKHYEGYEEDIRFTKSKGTAVEFFTNMHYIKKFIKKGDKVLEIGTATGAYAIELAKQGFDVTAIDLVQYNIDVLNKKAQDIKNLTAEKGDALDLSKFAENSFDMVLCFGPLYHLYSKQERMQAINEAIRVCKKDGILMFAFLTYSSIVWADGILWQQIDKIQEYMDKDGRLQNRPENVFSGYFIEDFEMQFENLNTQHIVNVASDGLAYIFRDYIDALPENKYKMFLNWHLSTCERRDQQGLSAHMLYICKKT